MAAFAEIQKGLTCKAPLSIKEYQRLTGSHQNIADLLAMPGIEEIEREIPHLCDRAQPADLS